MEKRIRNPLIAVAVFVAIVLALMGFNRGFSNYTHIDGEKQRIWIGDSRCVGMEYYRDGELDTYIALGGQGWSWFSNEAETQLRQYLDADPDYSVVIMMGVNDCANVAVGGQSLFAEEYAEEVNALIQDYPDTEFYYVSVNPVDGPYPSPYVESGEIGVNELNDSIDMFNTVIRKKCDATFIDVSPYLQKEGFATIDGIHYDQATYEMIYDYCVGEK